MNSCDAASDLNAFAKALEQRTLDLIESQSWAELDAMISPECQFVTQAGVLKKSDAMTLMQRMQLKSATMKNVKATAVGDNLVVSFYLACSELINGKQQSGDFTPRLSVWKKTGEEYSCIAYGDFATPA